MKFSQFLWTGRQLDSRSFWFIPILRINLSIDRLESEFDFGISEYSVFGVAVLFLGVFCCCKLSMAFLVFVMVHSINRMVSF